MSQLSKLMGKSQTEKMMKKKSSKKDVDGSKYIDITPELNEAPGASVGVISFGRMNPVTTGHEKLVNAVISTATKNGGDPLIYLSHSTDAKKNPLTYDQKIALAKNAFGSKLIVKSKARSILEVATELQNKFKELIVVVGSDRVKEFETLLNKYNGNLYTYDSIKVVSAGDRDPDADDVTGMSASKMRELAKQDNVESFQKGLPRKLQSQAAKIMSMVQAGMGIKEYSEEMELEEALTRQQRIKRKMLMRRLMPKILAGRRRAMRRKATTGVIKKRAMKAVRVALKKKFTKGMNYADLPYSARQRIDDRIARIPQARLQILMRRYIPKIKQKEKERFLNKIAKTKAPNILQKVASVPSTRKEEINLSFEAFLKEHNYFKNDNIVERAIELATELGANTNYAIKEIENLNKGLSRHYRVKEALERANKNVSENTYQQYTIEKRLKSQDPDVDHLPGTQPKDYYKGVEKDKKDDRAQHFARKSKMDDDNPKAYTPAPGDKEAKTKPSVHTNKFKQMFGEEVSQKQLNDLETFADRLLNKFDVDIEFTRHFADRMNDDRNKPAITIAQLEKLFKKMADNQGKKIKKYGNKEAILKDMQSDLNLPIIVNWKNGEFEVVHKTIMRKKNFKSPDPEVKYESVNKNISNTNLEKAMMKRPHMLLAKNGSVLLDKRFKLFRKTPEVDSMMSDIQAGCQTEELEHIMEAVEFIFESNPEKSLKDKAEKTGIPYGILKKVFDRGVAAWRTGHRPGTTPTQWGLARVNSFATKGKGTWGKADKDLAAKV